MIIYLYGPDTFRSREKLNELQVEFKKKRDPNGLNVVRFKGAEFTAQQFWDAVSSQGLFSPKRMVIVERVVTAGSVVLQDAILSQLKKLGLDTLESNAVTFWDEGECDGASPPRPARTSSRARSQKSKKQNRGGAQLHQWLLTQRYVFYYPRLQAGEVRTWIFKRARGYGATFAPGSAEVFRAAVGDDLWRADRELQKLAAYRSGAVITREDIGQFIEQPGEPPTLFEFLDAYVGGDTSLALTTLQDLIAAGTEPVVLAGQLARTIRVVSQVKSYMEDGDVLRKVQIAEDLHIHPFVARKAAQQSARLSWDAIMRMEQLALDLDFIIKNSGGSDPALPFETFLYRSMLR